MEFRRVLFRSDRPLLAGGGEDRVVAEALGAAPLVDDAALEHAGPAVLLALRREADELADVARATAFAFEAAELLQHLGDAVLGPSRRVQPRRAAEPGHLDARVLAERPLARLGPRAAEARLRQRVLVVALAFLGRHPVGLEELDSPAGERAGELPRLV